MFNNYELRRLVFIILILEAFFIVLNVIGGKVIYQVYSQKVLNRSAYIINDLVTEYPELEKDIISTISLSNSDKDGQAFFEKYGIDIDTISSNSREIQMRNTVMKEQVISFIIQQVILLVIIGIFIYHRYRSVQKMSEYINQIINENYRIDIREYEEGDFSNLKNDIYKVTVKLREYNEHVLSEKIYLATTLEDISHQLKTPLTSMYVIQDILENENDEKIRKEFLDKNRRQLERIEWLVSSLLKISRLDSGTIKLKKEKVNSILLINKVIEPIQLTIELKNIQLIKDTDSFSIVIDKNWTVEALVNILKNACEHTKENGKLMISCHDNPIYSELIIEDTGEGIDEKDLPHIFERFYKANSSKESIGIGLNIAKTIIDKQQGDIKVVSKKGKGTKFIIKFYKNII